MGPMARSGLAIVSAQSSAHVGALAEAGHAADAPPRFRSNAKVLIMKRTLQRAVFLSAIVLAPLGAMAQDTSGPPIPQQPGPTNTVPEPGSLALAGMALGLSIGLRVRRARRRALTKAE